MSLMDKIKNWFLVRRIKRVKRKRAFFDLDTANTFGVVFDATQEDLFKSAITFIKSLRNNGKNVVGLAYGQTKSALEFFEKHPNIDFFALSESSWLGYPKGQIVSDFYSKEFDVLINLDKSDNIQIKYVAGMSKAKLKIGRTGNNDLLYDFMLDLKDNQKLDNYIEQIVHYMSIIKATGSHNFSRG